MAENLDRNLKGTICYSNKVICKEFGRLYTWEQAQRACPKGWELPSWEHWEKLAETYDYSSLYEENKFNDHAFGGLKNRDGFNLKYHIAAYWTADEVDEQKAWTYQLDKRHASLIKLDRDKTDQLSCRCVKK